jgi:AbrB family looped-hinge helix DNA binding protein
MKTTAHIDRSGRVVVPKAFRDALHLRAGDRLHVRTEGDALVLEPEPVYAEVIEGDDGWPLLKNRGAPTPMTLEDFNKVLDDVREERHRRIVGEEP